MKTCSVPDCAKSAKAKNLCSMHFARLKRHGDVHIVHRDVGGPHAFAVSAAASQTDDCIMWPFSRLKNGYGHIRTAGKSMNAHRYVLSLVSPPPSSGCFVAAHKPLACHNRACVNPRHLRWATPKENAKDTEIDGTKLLGERTNNVRLTSSDILKIRNDDRTEKEIAADFDVSAATIGRVRRRENWSWL